MDRFPLHKSSIEPQREDAISSKAVHEILDTKIIEGDKCCSNVNELFNLWDDQCHTQCRISGHVACLYLDITVGINDIYINTL
jgi:hypothetical protein